MRLKYANGRLRSFVNIIMYSSIILAVTGELFGSSCLKEEALSKFRRSQIWVGSCSLDNNNEKIKNVLYSKTSRENLSKDNLMEVRDIVLQSGYKYDEVIMVLEDNYCLKYNPFTNEFNYG